MCWKQEWAHTINNMQKAIEHIEKAQDKLNKRKQRNEAALEKVCGKDKFEENKIRERFLKNTAGIEECKGIISNLKEIQDQLYRMIHEYGISHSDDPKRVYKLMGKYKPPIDLATKIVIK